MQVRLCFRMMVSSTLWEIGTISRRFLPIDDVVANKIDTVMLALIWWRGCSGGGLVVRRN